MGAPARNHKDHAQEQGAAYLQRQGEAGGVTVGNLFMGCFTHVLVGKTFLGFLRRLHSMHIGRGIEQLPAWLAWGVPLLHGSTT
jgi:hypothetical protein